MSDDRTAKERYQATHPAGIFLDGGDLSTLSALFDRHQWLAPGEKLLSATPHAKPTSNLVLHVQTDRRSLILKQARPWHEARPTVEMSDLRALVEARFFAVAAEDPLLARHHPRLIGVDDPSRALLFEDLSPLGDFSDLYTGSRVTQAELNTLVAYLSSLHALAVEKEPLFEGNAMRQERYDALLVIPIFDHDTATLDTETPGLAREAERLRQDERFFDGLRRLGDAFMADGPWLVHGDFVPTNWMRCPNGVNILGGEHAMKGRIELDIGMMLGHLMLAGQASPGWMLDEYEPPGEFDLKLAMGFAGAEIVRRVIGPDRVQTHPGLMQKRILLSLGKELVLRPDRELLG